MKDYRVGKDLYMNYIVPLDMNGIYAFFEKGMPASGKIPDDVGRCACSSLSFTKNFDVEAIDTCQVFIDYAKRIGINSYRQGAMDQHLAAKNDKKNIPCKNRVFF